MLTISVIVIIIYGAVCSGLPVARDGRNTDHATKRMPRVDVENDAIAQVKSNLEKVPRYPDSGYELTPLHVLKEIRDTYSKRIETRLDAGHTNNATVSFSSGTSETAGQLSVQQKDKHSRHTRCAEKSKIKRRNRFRRRRHFWFEALDSLGSGLIGK